MTWDPNVPAANTSPGRLPAKAATNWARLQAIIEEDHFFATSSDSTEGYHTLVHWIKRNSDPGALAGYATTFVQDATYRRSSGDITAPHLYHYPSSAEDSNIYPITPCPVRAFVNFNGTGAVGNQTIRGGYGVSTVNKTATGRYTLTFSPALPSADYAFIVCGKPQSSVEIMPFVVSGSTTSNTSLSIAFVDAGGGSGYRDVTIGSVAIIGG